MDARSDIFDDPKALLDPAFDPRQYSFLGVGIGDQASNLAGWDIAQTNEYGWQFLDGGVRFRVRDGAIAEIGLPKTFLDRLGIMTIEDLLRCFGAPDETKDISYRGRISVRAYIWRRGFAVWCSEIKRSCSHIVFWDRRDPS